MKITRGTYDGASEFAEFNKPVADMTPDEMRALLECILHLASPGEPISTTLFWWLSVAEQNAAMNGSPRRLWASPQP